MSSVKTKITGRETTAAGALEALAKAIANEHAETARLHAVIARQEAVIQTLVAQLSKSAAAPTSKKAPVVTTTAPAKKPVAAAKGKKPLTSTYLLHRIGRPTKAEAEARAAAGIVSKKKKRPNLSGRGPGRPSKNAPLVLAKPAAKKLAVKKKLTAAAEPQLVIMRRPRPERQAASTSKPQTTVKAGSGLSSKADAERQFARLLKAQDEQGL